MVPAVVEFSSSPQRRKDHGFLFSFNNLLSIPPLLKEAFLYLMKTPPQISGPITCRRMYFKYISYRILLLTSYEVSVQYIANNSEKVVMYQVILGVREHHGLEFQWLQVAMNGKEGQQFDPSDSFLLNLLTYDNCTSHCDNLAICFFQFFQDFSRIFSLSLQDTPGTFVCLWAETSPFLQ